MRQYKETAPPKRSPWGRVDISHELAPGIWLVSTPRHGGVKLSPERNRVIPEYMRNSNGWYEEDIEWSIPATVFPEVIFSPDMTMEYVYSILRNWLPKAYERYFRVELKPGQSTKKDEDQFYTEHAEDLIVVSAYGSWADWVPDGMVGVLAMPGGNRRFNHEAGRWFLVPESEYANRSPYGFLIDIDRHPEFTNARIEAT